MINLYPNCSESTMRINCDNLSDEEIKNINDWLKETSKASEYYEGNDEFDPRHWSWNNSSWKTKNIFGKVKVIEIKGDIPFNNGDNLKKEIMKIVPKLKNKDFEEDEQ